MAAPLFENVPPQQSGGRGEIAEPGLLVYGFGVGLFSADTERLCDETPHDTERKAKTRRPVTATLAATSPVVARAVDVLA